MPCESLKIGRQILGNDLISPEEIVAAVCGGVTYSSKQLCELGNTVPGAEVLEWCAANGFVVVPGPSRPMSLLDIRREFNHAVQGGWYMQDSELFARRNVVLPHWIALRKGLVPGSNIKTWDEQQKLLSNLEVTPNVAEQVWGMVMYKAVRGVWITTKWEVRTASVDFYGQNVIVGLSEGLVYLPNCHNENRDGLVGVASARRW